MNPMSEAVLLLNSSYEPLNVISVRRALRLIFSQKASVLDKGEDKSLRSVSGTLCIPVVVRMSYYVSRPSQRTKFSKRNILLRDNFTCMYCGERVPSEKLTIDHIVPKDSGGVTSWQNCVAACKRCNGKKGNRSLKESGMKLLKVPKEPRFLPYLRMVKGKGSHAWDRYLFISEDNASPYLIHGEPPKEKK